MYSLEPCVLLYQGIGSSYLSSYIGNRQVVDCYSDRNRNFYLMNRIGSRVDVLLETHHHCSYHHRTLYTANPQERIWGSRFGTLVPWNLGCWLSLRICLCKPQRRARLYFAKWHSYYLSPSCNDSMSESDSSCIRFRPSKKDTLCCQKMSHFLRIHALLIGLKQGFERVDLVQGVAGRRIGELFTKCVEFR